MKLRGTLLWALSSMVLATIPQARASATTAFDASSDPAQYVNPFVGTQNGGSTFPGADVPFGMVQWSPDTLD